MVESSVCPSNSLIASSGTPFEATGIENLMFSYNTKFQEYFNIIIDEIMPTDYLKMKILNGQSL